MKTLNFLNACLERGYNAELALSRLEERYAIKTRVYEDRGLVVLNYSQIDSPKFDDITKECRSLVLQLPNAPVTNFPRSVERGTEDYYLSSFQVISRAFDRFFNYQEKMLPCKVDKLKFHDKLDGSLISLFHHNGEWLYRTKSMIMPVESINGLDVTWKELIEEALGWDSLDFNELSPTHTYIFEVVSPYNRIVTRYEKPEAYLLAIRSQKDIYVVDWVQDEFAKNMGWKRPNTFSFESWEDCLTGAQERRNLEEGYVGYLNGVPTTKVKNPAYVAAHHLRGEGVLTPKRIVDLILINETAEYLSIFPEDEVHFTPWI